MIQSLVSEGLFELGYRGESGPFAAWDDQLEQSMEAIYEAGASPAKAFTGRVILSAAYAGRFDVTTVAAQVY